MTDCRAALEDSLTVSLKKRRAEVRRKHKRLRASHSFFCMIAVRSWRISDGQTRTLPQASWAIPGGGTLVGDGLWYRAWEVFNVHSREGFAPSRQEKFASSLKFATLLHLHKIGGRVLAVHAGARAPRGGATRQGVVLTDLQ
jgi:hypothetical protein